MRHFLNCVCLVPNRRIISKQIHKNKEVNVAYFKPWENIHYQLLDPIHEWMHAYGINSLVCTMQHALLDEIFEIW
jgi:hypothetical protein